MTIHRKPFTGSSSNRGLYLSALCRHAHELVLMGYDRLVPLDHISSDEPEITGELVRAMRQAMQETDAPEWVGRYAFPKDDPPLDVPGRYGKARPRIDIEFECVTRGPRPTLRFEAKRLGPSHPVSGYLGKEGLGCFLTGKYPLTGREAGMLGYVQSDDEDVWAGKIADRLREDPAGYSLRPDGSWREARIIASCRHTYRTVHTGPQSNGPLTIYHMLLCFCQAV